MTGSAGAGGRRIRLRDAALPLALALLATPLTVGAGLRTELDRPVDATGLLLVAASALALLGRRRWPVATLAAVTMLITIYLWSDYPYGPIFVSFLVAVYTVARWLTLRVALPAAAAALLVLLSHLLGGQATNPGWLGLVPGAAWVAAPFAVGVSVRLWRENAARDRDEQVRRHVDAERLRVAREVHDVVGHGLAAINMQANVALHVLARDPSRAESALRAISSSSAAALDELRATLSVVRHDDADAASRQPAPGLGRLGDLFARMREAGMLVEVTTTGQRREVPAAVGLAAYRVLQESLTNVLRHAPTKEATVGLTYRPDGLAVEVGNPARPGAPTRPGFGVSGMRERVEALGGTFSAGNVEPARFEVMAWLPTEGRP